MKGGVKGQGGSLRKKETLGDSGLPDVKSRPQRAAFHLPGTPSPLPPLSLASQGVLCQPSPSGNIDALVSSIGQLAGDESGVWGPQKEPGNII